MTKEFLQEHNMEEVAAQFDQELREFNDVVNTIDDVERLEELEQEVIKEQDEVNQYLKEVTYELQPSVVFEGETFKLTDVAKSIIYFINKREVEWKYTLGLYQLVNFWKRSNPTTVEYSVYDSTLRILNQNTYKGYSEWKDILVCNEYFKSAHESYSKDTSWLIFESEKHNIVIDRMTALNKLQNEIEQPCCNVEYTRRNIE